MSSTSNHTGADIIIPTETHRVTDFVETNTVWSTNPDATPPPQTGIAGVEALLQRLLPRTPVIALLARPGPARRDWNTIVCFSCGKSGHRVSRCPKINETIPYNLPGWTTEEVGGSYVMISPRG